MTQFPDHFTWGAAAASYQIEGAVNADGRGESVWDMHCRKRDAIWRGQSGAEACDHYHRYREDVGLMADIGLQGYRLSLAWPRILPEGIGKVNAKGLAFYDRLVDALLEKKIQPYITLFHWDFPLSLFYRGGWLNRDSAEWFGEYTQVVAERLSDRVTHWITLNEPQMFIALGHVNGAHAPGIRLADKEVLTINHNVMRAHGRAVQVLRAAGKQPLKIGCAPVGFIRVPETESKADIEAARSDMFAVNNTGHFNNTWYVDPILTGNYPEDGWALFGKDVPEVKAGDMELMHQPIDFYGVNIYGGSVVKAGPDGKAVEVAEYDGFPKTAFDWWVRPEALRWGPRFLYERYSLPVVITENGLSNVDWVDLDGNVRDPQRIDYTRRYLRELRKAIDDGAKIDGYFHWSVMDNFEWAEGYKQRFGLIHVDYPTGKRTLKESAHWYREVIQSNGANL